MWFLIFFGIIVLFLIEKCNYLPWVHAIQFVSFTVLSFAITHSFHACSAMNPIYLFTSIWLGFSLFLYLTRWEACDCNKRSELKMQLFLLKLPKLKSYFELMWEWCEVTLTFLSRWRVHYLKYECFIPGNLWWQLSQEPTVHHINGCVVYCYCLGLFNIWCNGEHVLGFFGYLFYDRSHLLPFSVIWRLWLKFL